MRIGDGFETDFALGVAAGRGLSRTWRVQGRTIDLLTETTTLFAEMRDARDADYTSWVAAGANVVDAGMSAGTSTTGWGRAHDRAAGHARLETSAFRGGPPVLDALGALTDQQVDLGSANKQRRKNIYAEQLVLAGEEFPLLSMLRNIAGLRAELDYRFSGERADDLDQDAVIWIDGSDDGDTTSPRWSTTTCSGSG